MELVGYSNVWSVRPGETISFHIHSTAKIYDAQLVRLHHGDESPFGPGFKETELESTLNGSHAGEARVIHKGSFGSAPAKLPDAFTLSGWIWPTVPGRGTQSVFAGRDADGKTAWSVTLNDAGELELRTGPTTVGRVAAPLDPREWYFFAATIDASNKSGLLYVKRLRFNPSMRSAMVATGDLTAPLAETRELVFAAGTLSAAGGTAVASDIYNGKLAAARVFGRALSEAEIAGLAENKEPAGVIAAWDFSQKTGGKQIVDVGGNGWHGKLVNRPARLMTGPFWAGETPDAGLHNAIHFHDDDVNDAGWPVSLEFEVPADMKNGVYAVRLRTETAEDYLPFFVCPPRGRPQSRIAFLIPTLSYLVYSNESLDVSSSPDTAPLQDMSLHPEAYEYVAANGLKSAYDTHSDGSGICYVSIRRPIIDFRPKARCRTFDAPHQFPADLYMIDWLEQKGFEFDVITDHELHAEGVDLLFDYSCVITGSHPEYWSRRMMAARDSFLAAGGRLMYLGGNGFYWVTSVSDEDPGLVEVRRWAGWRTWQAEPGETWMSVSGEQSGLWRDQGASPQKQLGIGFTGAGYDRGLPYKRSPESFSPRFYFVFEDVDTEVVGAGRSLVLNRGAAGFELDSVNRRLGTPDHAVILATAQARTNSYQFAVEELLSPSPSDGGSSNPDLRADMVIVEHPNGGAVFSVGSVIWLATLSADNYNSDTSCITANVLRAFSQPDWRLAP